MLGFKLNHVSKIGYWSMALLMMPWGLHVLPVGIEAWIVNLISIDPVRYDYLSMPLTHRGRYMHQ